MIPSTHPFGFAEGRLFSQSARKGWGNWLSQLRSSPFLRNTALSPATLKATLFLSRSLCSWRADWRPAMMVSNWSALWSARAWLQSSRILSSSRRFGTLTAEAFYPQIGGVCDTTHTVFLGGRGPTLRFFRVGFRGRLRRGFSWWFVQRPGSERQLPSLRSAWTAEGGCPYAGGFRYVDGRGRLSLHQHIYA